MRATRYRAAVLLDGDQAAEEQPYETYLPLFDEVLRYVRLPHRRRASQRWQYRILCCGRTFWPRWRERTRALL